MDVQFFPLNRSDRRLQNILVLAHAVAIFPTVFIGAHITLEIRATPLFTAFKRLFRITDFCYCAIVDGVREVRARSLRQVPRPTDQPRQLAVYPPEFSGQILTPNPLPREPEHGIQGATTSRPPCPILGMQLAQLQGPLMLELLSFISYLITLYTYVIIASVVMSWLIGFNVINAHNPFVRSLWQGVNAMTEPLLGPIRRMLPNLGAIDISPLVLLLACFFVQSVVLTNAAKLFK